MEDFITAITAAVTPAALWAVLAGSAVFIGTLVVFAFGYRVVKRLVSGASRGKAKL